MRKLWALALSVFLALAIGKASALISSYGGATGYALVQQSVSVQVVEQYSDVLYNASNETYYELYDPHQGETKWVELKLSNDADVALSVNVTAIIAKGDPASVNMSRWNIHKNVSLDNPITLWAGGYTYVYLKHVISQAASPGEYGFLISVTP